MANNENLGSKKIEQTQENENFVTKILSFFNKYQNIIYGVIIGILVVVLAILAFITAILAAFISDFFTLERLIWLSE